MLKEILKLTFALILIFLIVPLKAQAYLDPGSGSYLTQILIASLFGAGYLTKAYWGKLKNIFSKKDRKKSKNGKED